jgi:hypothetical protein
LFAIIRWRSKDCTKSGIYVDFEIATGRL